MQIDLSLLRGVSVDPKTRIARVAGGSLSADMDYEADGARACDDGRHGLAHRCRRPHAGRRLSDGLARRFGLALDNVRAVEIGLRRCQIPSRATA